jgi:hypothetical protein
MKSIIQFKRATPPLLITLLLLCFGPLTAVQAVVPPPDGGYPNFNTAEGQNALFSLTTGPANTAVGWYSLFSDTGGSYNTGVGAGSLVFNNNGEENTAIGVAALLLNTNGFQNTAIGSLALLNNGIGIQNTAIGGSALQNNAGGGGNTATGFLALSSNIDGNLNTAYGDQALKFNTSGSSNIALGNSAGNNVVTADHVICIGALGEDVSDSCYIGQIFGATSSNGIGVLVNSNGRLGTTTSSRRFKEEIKPMDQASEALFALKPVSFRYKKGIDPAGTSQLGLVAEDVEKVNPDLIVRDKEGNPYSVRYDQVNAMLLNEFLKEHRKVEQQEATITELKSTAAKQEAAIGQQRKDFEATITELKKEMETLVARSKEQDAKIQIVSDRMESSNSARLAVSNR